MLSLDGRNPTQATQKVLRELEKQFDADAYRIAASGTTEARESLWEA